MGGGWASRGGGALRREGEEGVEYAVISAHPPAQPVATGEGVYENTP